MWFYKQTEAGVFTVGCMGDGEWHSDSDFGSRDEARHRVHYLNGGCAPSVDEVFRALDEISERLAGVMTATLAAVKRE